MEIPLDPIKSFLLYTSRAEQGYHASTRQVPLGWQLDAL